ncbi:MAG: hypothetical protein Kow0080_17570 [Candidatus Promineifilaceae bacterium]
MVEAFYDLVVLFLADSLEHAKNFVTLTQKLNVPLITVLSSEALPEWETAVLSYGALDCLFEQDLSPSWIKRYLHLAIEQYRQTHKHAANRFTPPDLICIFNAATMELTYMNREHYLGHALADMFSHENLLTLVHPDDVELVITHWEDILKGHVSEGIIEYRVKDSRGQWQWIHSWEGVFRADENGRPDQIILTQSNITTQKHIQEEAYKLSERLKLIHIIDKAILSVEDPKIIAEKALPLICQFSNAQRASIYIFDQANQTGQRLALVGQSVSNDENAIIPLEKLENVPLLMQGKYAYVPDITEVDNPYALAIARLGMRSALVIPLNAQGELIGALYLFAKAVNAFAHEGDIQLIQELADPLAIALYHAQLLEKTKKQAEELHQREAFLLLLAEITEQALREENLPQMLTAVAKPLAELFKADGSHITLWDELNQTTIPVAASGIYAEGYDQIKVKPGTPTYTMAALKAGHVLALENTQEASLLDPKLASRFPGVHAALILPLIAKKHKLGAAILVYKGKRPFSEQEIAWAEQTGQLLALAIAKSQILLIEKQQRLFCEALQEVARSLNSSLDKQEVLQLILKHLNRVVDYDSASVMLLQDGQLKLEAFHSSYHTAVQKSTVSLKTVEYQKFPHLQEVIEQQRPVIINNAQTYPGWQLLPTTPSIYSWMGIPLIYKNQAIGLMNVSKSKVGYFTQQHAQLGTYLADHAVVALENARLFESAQRQLHELQLLNEIASAGTEVLNEDALIAKVTAVFGESLYPHHFGFLIYDEKIKKLVPHPSFRYSTPHETVPPPVPPNQGIVGEVFRTGRPKLVQDISKEKKYYQIEPTTRSELAAPLRVHNRIIGVINIESPEPNGLTPNDLRLLMTLAGQVATAIEKTRLLAAERLRRHEADQLRRATAALTSSLELEAVLQTILEQLQMVVAYDSAAIQLIESDHFIVVAAHGFTNPQKVIGRTYSRQDEIMQHLQYTKEPIIIPDAQTDSRFQGLGGTHYTRGWIGVPLLVRDEMIGALTLDSRTIGAYTQNDAALAMAFANQAATAIANARLYHASATQSENLQIASDILALLNSSVEVSDTLPEIAQILKKLTRCDMVTLTITKGSTETALLIPVEKGISLAHGLSFNLQETAAYQSIIQGKMHVTPDLAKAREYPTENALYDLGVRSGITLPMTTPDHVLGSLNLVWLRTNGPNKAQFPILKQIAQAVALGIERSQIFNELSYRLKQMATLHEISRQITGILDSNNLYDLIVSTLHEKMGYPSASVYLIDEVAQELVFQAAAGQNSNAIVHYRQSITKGLLGLAARQNEIIVVNDTSQHPDYVPCKGLTALSEAVFPLRSGNKLLGVLNVDSSEKNAFDERDTAVLTILADQLSVALEKIRLFEETHRHAAELEIIADISTALREATTVSEMVPILLDKSLKLTNATQVTVFLWNDETNMLEVRGTYPPELAATLHAGTDEINRAVLAANKPYLSPRLANHLHMEILIKDGNLLADNQHCVRLPLRTQERAIGVLQLQLQDDRYLSVQDLRLLTAVSDITGSALARAIVFESLEERVEARTRELAQANRRLQELDQLKSKFVSDVSHELRTPVTNLGLYLDLLERGDPSRRQNYMDILRIQVKRLGQLIGDILNLSRLEMTSSELKLEPVSLHDIIRPIIDAHQPRIQQSGLELLVELDDTIPQVLGERNQIAQIIANLLSNSINYTSAGFVAVRTRFNPKENMVALEVEDSGIGIPPEEHALLFDRFYRGKEVSQLNIPGTGLGLAIVHEIVQLHHGRIDLQSTPDKGTTFTIWLQAVTSP